MKKMEEQSGYVPIARHHDEQQYGTLCVQQIWTDTMARSYWSLSLRPAEERRDRIPLIVIYPDDSRPKKEERAFSSLSLNNLRMHSYILIHKIQYPDIVWLTVTH